MSYLGELYEPNNGILSTIKSHVTMLPIIDLHTTDFTALQFVEKQYKNLNVALPCVTFDQQVHIKAYKMPLQ